MGKRVSTEQALEELREWANDLCEDELADTYAELIGGGNWEYDGKTKCLVEIDDIEEAVREIVEEVGDGTDEETTAAQALEAVVNRWRADLDRTIKEARERLASVP